MSITLNTNPSGEVARQNFTDNVFFLSASVRQLSSGLRINQSADDPVTVSLASDQGSQSASLGQAAKNANDGIAALQVVDNTLATALGLIGEIQTKAQTAAQAGTSDATRLLLQADITKLVGEVDHLTSQASYHDVPLLRGSYSHKELQLGALAGQTLSLTLPAAGSYQIGQLQAGELTISSPVGGQADFTLTAQGNGEAIRINSVQLAYANNPANGMGALAQAINAYSAATGITAQALVQSTSAGAITAGSSTTNFSVNGVLIGQVVVKAADSDGSLIQAINAKTGSHGVTAQVTASGQLVLSTADGRPIAISGSGGGLGFTDQEMTTFGLTRVRQPGPYILSFTDHALGLSAPFAPALALANPMTTGIDSTLTANSLLGVGSQLAAGWTAGGAITGPGLTGGIATTSSSTLNQGSVLDAGSLLAAGSTLGGSTTLGAGFATSQANILKAGSLLASGSLLGQGTYLTNDIISTGGPLAAGQTLTAAVTLASPLTLGRDLMLQGASNLASGSSLTAGAVLGDPLTLTSPLTVNESAMTLAPGSTIANGGGATVIAPGSTIGGPAQLAVNVNVSQAMLLPAGSTLPAASELGLGSTVGGSATLAGNQTASQDLYLAAGSVIASGSLIASGTYLTNPLSTTSGTLVAGSTLAQAYQTSGVNPLGQAMTLRQGSTLAGGSTLAESSVNQAPVQLGQETSFRLNDLDVTSQDRAGLAVAISQAAWSDLDSIRRQAAAVSDQLAGAASSLGSAQAMADHAQSQMTAVDFGDEAANFTRMQMLIRTSSFAVTQANAVPANVLMIMQGGTNKATQFFIMALNRFVSGVS